MLKWIKKVAIVTGANSGNGFAILKQLAEQGLVVVGLDINIDAIDKLKEGNGCLKINSMMCDVTKDESVEAAFRWVEDKFGGVEILINNAGMLRDIGKCGSPLPFMVLNKIHSLVSVGILEHDKPMSELAKNVDLNFTAVVRCARLAFKSMESRGAYGMIINMNSVYGHYVAPIKLMNVGVYPGTKHAITATSEVMRRELIRVENHKVRVTR